MSSSKQQSTSGKKGFSCTCLALQITCYCCYPKAARGELRRLQNPIEAAMNDLPERAFERILSELSMRDRLSCRAVSRAWRKKFDFKVQSLCFSTISRERIYEKARLAGGVFARNFLRSSRSASFFCTFRRTVLSNLKHLRLCDLRFNVEKESALGASLSELRQLEELSITRLVVHISEGYHVNSYGMLKLDPKILVVLGGDAVLELRLPMLQSIQLEYLESIERVILDTPKLKRIKLLRASSRVGFLAFKRPMSVGIVHCGSVERADIDELTSIALNELKNLKYIYYKPRSNSRLIDPTLLSNLRQLKEFHLANGRNLKELFEQKQRYGRRDLKIFYCGLLLDGPDHRSFTHSNIIARLAADRWSELADEIPFHRSLHYSDIESVPAERAFELLFRFTDLDVLEINVPVQDIERFLGFLSRFANVVYLKFWHAQPELFDRLPGHCAVQRLEIDKIRPGFTLDFLFRLKDLLYFKVDHSIDAKSIRKAFEQLKYLLALDFRYDKNEIRFRRHCPNLFEVSIGERLLRVPHVNAAIELVMRNSRWSGKKEEEGSRQAESATNQIEN